MKSYARLLMDIRADPKSFLGAESCTRLEAFLKGVDITGPALQCLATPKNSSMVDFNHWMENKAGISGPFNAFGIARFISRDDREAFFNYFDCLDEFSRQNPGHFSEECVSKFNGISCSRKELIDNVRKKPPLYLGVKSVIRLRCFLDGDFYIRKHANGVNCEPDLTEFEKWMRVRQELKRAVPLENIAILMSMSDEAGAFDWFFSQYDEWCIETAKTKRFLLS